MIPKALFLLLGSLALLSCGKDWQIANGPIDRSGGSRSEAEGTDPEAGATLSGRPAGPRTRVTKPLPISGNPFDVPDVTRDLPAERDLKAGAPQPPSVPVDPEEPTVRASPGSGE